MAFDTETRKKLARMVAEIRAILQTEFTSQLQEIYGIQPDGSMADIEKLSLSTTSSGISHGCCASGWRILPAAWQDETTDPDGHRPHDPEQSFPLLNRFAALRMCEERKLIQQCVGAGMDSEGFAVYLLRLPEPVWEIVMIATALSSFVFLTKLRVDLGILFDRFSPIGLAVSEGSRFRDELAGLSYYQTELKHIWTGR